MGYFSLGCTKPVDRIPVFHTSVGFLQELDYIICSSFNLWRFFVVFYQTCRNIYCKDVHFYRIRTAIQFWKQSDHTWTKGGSSPIWTGLENHFSQKMRLFFKTPKNEARKDFAQKIWKFWLIFFSILVNFYFSQFLPFLSFIIFMYPCSPRIDISAWFLAIWIKKEGFSL